MNKKLKMVLNISIIVVLVVVFATLIIMNLTKPNYKYKLELSNITFYSDNNILESFNTIKDSNSIILVLDQTTNKYTLDNAILYLQIFSYMQKENLFYILSKDNSCTYSNAKTLKVTTTTVDDCKKILNESSLTIIYLGNLNKDKTTVEIKNNFYYINTTTLGNSFTENHNFLQLLYPNLSEIEKAIEGFTSDFANKQNSK